MTAGGMGHMAWARREYDACGQRGQGPPGRREGVEVHQQSRGEDREDENGPGDQRGIPQHVRYECEQVEQTHGGDVSGATVVPQTEIGIGPG